MDNIPSLMIMQKSFEDQFQSFDYDFYNDVISQRQFNTIGHPNGSSLVKEVASISAYFMPKYIREELSIEYACHCAFMGWKLSHDFLSKEASTFKIKTALTKFTKEIYRAYKELEINLNKSDIAWLIFCCALIREKLYKDFLYDMLGFFIEEDSGETKINVAYTLV